MDLREDAVESNEVFKGRLLTVRVDKVRLPDGEQTTREIVVHPGSIAAVPLIDNDRLVMVRQFRQAAGDILLEIPAGTLEPFEEPDVCARRELREEIGYEPGRLELMFSSYLAPGYSSELLHTFLARDLVRVGQDQEPDEFIEVVEMPLAEAVKKISLGEIKDAKTICGILMAQQILSS